MSDFYKTLWIESKTEKLAEELKKQYELDAYQALDIALKVERNQILSRAFSIDNSDTITALEKLVNVLEER